MPPVADPDPEAGDPRIHHVVAFAWLRRVLGNLGHPLIGQLLPTAVGYSLAVGALLSRTVSIRLVTGSLGEHWGANSGVVTCCPQLPAGYIKRKKMQCLSAFLLSVVTDCFCRFPGQRTPVNRMVAGSNPARGANQINRLQYNRPRRPSARTRVVWANRLPVAGGSPDCAEVRHIKE